MMERKKKALMLAEALCVELGLPVAQAGRFLSLFVERVKRGQPKPLDGDWFPVRSTDQKLSLEEL